MYRLSLLFALSTASSCDGDGALPLPPDEDTGESMPSADSTSEPEDSATTPKGTGDTSEGNSGQRQPQSCMEGMVGIPDPEDATRLLFCIDTYENVVSGSLGSPDQWSEGAEPTEAVSISIAGETPTTLISFSQAVEVCANTALLDGSGDEVGRKRIPLASEWEDAYDGVVGPGGNPYPYGDEFDETLCATLSVENEKLHDGLVPTGSMKHCVSDFGTYDQLGNAFEWTDSEVTIDIDEWLEHGSHIGASFSIADGDCLTSESDEGLQELLPQIVGLSDHTLSRDEEGYLFYPVDQFAVDAPVDGGGFLQLVIADVTQPAGDFLPVHLVPRGDEKNPSGYRLAVDLAIDGAPLADKRGCAWYSGDVLNCTGDKRGIGHYHDFDGTIGFRCVSDPIEHALTAD